MKQEIDNIVKTLGDLKQAKQVLGLYNEYLRYIKAGKTLEEGQIKNKAIYEKAREIYSSGREEEQAQYEVEIYEEYMKMLDIEFAKLQPQLGSDFIRDSMEYIENGQMDKVKDELLDVKQRVRTKTIRSIYDCRDINEKDLWEKTEKESPIKAKLFGVKVEVLPRTERVERVKSSKTKPKEITIKGTIDKMLETLNIMKEESTLMELYDKYFESIRNGKELPKKDIENIRIYNMAKKLVATNQTDILKETQANTNNKHKQSLNKNLELLGKKVDLQYISDCKKDMQNNDFKNLETNLTILRDNIKTKTLKSASDCNTYEEHTALMIARKKASVFEKIKEKLFGIKVKVDVEVVEEPEEVVENEKTIHTEVEKTNEYTGTRFKPTTNTKIKEEKNQIATRYKVNVNANSGTRFKPTTNTEVKEETNQIATRYKTNVDEEERIHD